MERNLHTDDFERLLREKSDEFRMYPSRRIWHSVYNNIHPGRKWPSVAMSITLLSILLLVGYLNTKQSDPYTSGDSKRNWQQEYDLVMAANYKAPGINEYHNHFTASIYANGLSRQTGSQAAIANKQEMQSLDVSAENIRNKSSKTVLASSAGFPSSQKGSRVSHNNNTLSMNSQGLNQPGSNYNVNTSPLPTYNEAVPGNPLAVEKDVVETTIEAHPTLEFLVPANIGHLSSYPESYEQTRVISPAVLPNFVSPVNAPLETQDHSSEVKPVSAVSAEQKAWIEHYALYNRPATKKWANRLAWQLYVTPSLVYRTLYNDADWGRTGNNVTPIAVPPSSQDINSTVVHTPSFGFEMGSGLQYNLFKGVKFRGGLQVNYTRYNAHAYQNSHPIATKLTMHDHHSHTSYEVYRTTPYSNKNGLDKTKLHNETFQVALPVGLDFRLAGTEQLQLNVGVSLQPTYIVGGKSYLISSDRRNYVLESSMLNQWNLNAGFETFVSYKVNGLNWQVGPQFRTQLFSTNSKNFAIEERLMNFGIKFGVSKTIR